MHRFSLVAALILCPFIACTDSASDAPSAADAAMDGATMTDGSAGGEDAAMETDPDGGVETGPDATIDADRPVGAQARPGEVPSCAEIIAALGAAGVAGAAPDAVANYERAFRRLDADGDGVVTLAEYIDSGHFDEMKAQLIFAATDRDQDGIMTEREYVENRIITDEAKLIFEGLDTNGDGVLVEAEFVENAPFDAAVAAIIYGYLDPDGDGEVMVPEYLRVWGAWARDERCP